MNNDVPWQLKMFQKTLKKKLRLKALKKHIGRLSEDDLCLLVTCGDNNGAINYYLREIGGKWSWADIEEKSVEETSELLQSPVQHVKGKRLPYDDEQFDWAISIDVHEHLQDPNPFTAELQRVLKKNGIIVITVPNGDQTKIATRIKNFVGMTKDYYGHVREGLTIPELKELMLTNGIEPQAESTFSKFFTEILELAINLIYVKVLSKRSSAKVGKGTIAPATENQLKSIGKTYRLYSLIYPFFAVVSKFDLLFWGTEGYVVMVEGRKG